MSLNATNKRFDNNKLFYIHVTPAKLLKMKLVGFLYAVKRLFITVVIIVGVYILHLLMLQETHILEAEKLIENYSQNDILKYRFVSDLVDSIEKEEICGFEDLIGHTDVYSIETPLNETMRKLTPSFDDLRERFNRTTRVRFLPEFENI